MAELELNPNLRTWVMFVVAIGGSIFFATPIVAQSGGDPAKLQTEEMNRRELQLNVLPGGNNARRDDRKRDQAMMAQVSEDFQRILTLHNEIVRAVIAHQSLSYQFISDATGEIRKRSARLQTSLKLPKPEPARESQPAVNELRITPTNDGLILLCKQIEIFVRNPIIEKPGTIDAAQQDKARKDLQSIVELSDAIKKLVDKQKP
jgi:hypothetical protein